MTLREKAALGLAILTVLKVSGTVIARLAAIILALLLSPEDVGLGTELVRRSDASPATLESAFTIRIGMAGVIMASTPLTGAFVAWAYRDPRFALLIPITTIPVLAFAVAFPSRILALQRLQ